ncbi:MAG: hypothetical protein ACKV2T_22465 [Kofleriaceae bacterium]
MTKREDDESEVPMSDAELARLNDALVCGFEQIERKQFRSAADVIADLRRR